MRAIKFETRVDERVVAAIPSLEPMAGRRVEIIALETGSGEPDSRPTVTLDEVVAHRLVRPEGVEPVSLADMEAAIARGAAGGDI